MATTIRNELPADYRAVETLTREAFWNLHAPGCDEHLLAHKLRRHPDFVPALDFVVEQDGQLIANIMFSESSVINDDGGVVKTLSFGPVSVLPAYQQRGIGSQLINHALTLASELPYPAVIIWGYPGHYCKFGFQVSKTFNICVPGGKFPSCLLVKPLKPQALENRLWYFADSDAFTIDQGELEAFDSGFPARAKATQYTQEVFAILSQSYLA